MALMTVNLCVCDLGLSLSERVFESTSLRDRMAKYQAAVSKKDAASIGSSSMCVCTCHPTILLLNSYMNLETLSSN